MWTFLPLGAPPIVPDRAAIGYGGVPFQRRLFGIRCDDVPIGSHRAAPHAATLAREHQKRAAGRRRLLPNRVGLGPLAAPVSAQISPWLRRANGPETPGDRGRSSARGARSA